LHPGRAIIALQGKDWSRGLSAPESNSLDAAGQEFWNTRWQHLPPICKYHGPVFEQHPVLRRFLAPVNGQDAIEIGCVPGNWLIYLHKEYGYRVSGIDYSEYLDYVRQNLAHNGVEPLELIYADLFHYVPNRKYDLVFSSGFVEHFDDHELVVRKHSEVAKPGGLVIIMVPNLTHIHRVLARMFDPQGLRVHRFPLMHRKVLRSTLEKCGLEVLHCEYNKTFRPPYALPQPFDLGSRAVQKALRLLSLDNIGNQFGSPYLISVSRKR
jgi:SAM-dependent methyltransferase